MTDWSLAACRDTDRDAFFADDYATQKIAKRVCAECVIRFACLEEAMRFRLEGVWGATSTEDRDRIRRRQQRRAAKERAA